MYGLLGYPLGHSFSKQYFEGKLDYRNFEYANIAQFLENIPEDLQGFNVTIPHKQAILPYLDQFSNEVQTIGAVNCVQVVGGKLIGHNTDCYGFKASLERFLDGCKVEKALVFGNGGASQAVQYALNKMGIDYQVVSRSGELNYQNLQNDLLVRSTLLVNCTSLGMNPNVDSCVEINYELLTKNHYLYDLVYNPAQTKFLKQGLAKGCKIKNGLEMLRLQADKSFEIWTL